MEQDIKDLINEEIDLIKAEEEEAEIEPETEIKAEETENVEDIDYSVENTPHALATADTFQGNSAVGIINTTKDKILEKAELQIKQEKIINKHASELSKVADNLMKVETDKAAIEVQKKDASNKAEKQEIENRLIVLRNEAKRLRKEEEHKNRLQKIQIQAEKKQKQWEMLESTLKPLGYNYVPNPVALYILLMLVGLKAFFNGIGAVGTALLKCVKWFLILGFVIAVVLIIPVTRTEILQLLGFLR